MSAVAWQNWHVFADGLVADTAVAVVKIEAAAAAVAQREHRGEAAVGGDRDGAEWGCARPPARGLASNFVLQMGTKTPVSVV